MSAVWIITIRDDEDNFLELEVVDTAREEVSQLAASFAGLMQMTNNGKPTATVHKKGGGFKSTVYAPKAD